VLVRAGDKMADDDSKYPRPRVATGGSDRLVVPESGKSVNERKPFNVDGIICICGQQSFFVGIAETGKDCTFCGSLIVGRCQGCSTWSCMGCLEKAAKAERERSGVGVLGGTGRLFS
jgi:hypothetical protein